MYGNGNRITRCYAVLVLVLCIAGRKRAARSWIECCTFNDARGHWQLDVSFTSTDELCPRKLGTTVLACTAMCDSPANGEHTHTHTHTHAAHACKCRDFMPTVVMHR